MSPHHSTQSRAHTPKGSSDFTSNPISRRSKSDSEISDGSLGHVLCPTSNTFAGSLSGRSAGREELGYDMSRFNDHIQPNPFSCYEIKANQCDNGRGDSIESSRKHNNNNTDMHFWSYPNLSQNYSSNDRLCNVGNKSSSNNGFKRYSTGKQSSGHGVPFYYGLGGGRGFGRGPSCWSRRKVCININRLSILILLLLIFIQNTQDIFN